MADTMELAVRVGQVLRDHGLMLTTTESCTGGGVARTITEIAGSSAWFDCGFITYSNASKMHLLQVPEAVLAQHGAVSQETAAAMCQGALANSKASVALSTTGIAGPDGGTSDKPVGLVCFGWAVCTQIHTEQMIFSGDRHAVREQSVAYALQGLLNILDTAP